MGQRLAEDRLQVLRAIDLERKWYSLDDKRVCVVCERVITGRQIKITKLLNGAITLKCPTPGCPANFRHWLLCEVSPARYEGHYPFPLPDIGR